jgi:nucleoside-diphosphate-sugar epimerase
VWRNRTGRLGPGQQRRGIGAASLKRSEGSRSGTRNRVRGLRTASRQSMWWWCWRCWDGPRRRRIAARHASAPVASPSDARSGANVDSLRVLLDEMNESKVGAVLLSSSAAVYGVPRGPVVSEDSATVPINRTAKRSVGTACGLSWIRLRCFNVVGTVHPILAERTGTSLVPMAFRQALAGRPVTVTGTDYPTRDGTGVRDYVHVADAHALAIRHLEREAVGGGLQRWHRVRTLDTGRAGRGAAGDRTLS